MRLFLYFLFRLWLKKIHHKERLPKKGPCIIIANHTSYVDWIIISAIYRANYLVFLGNQELKGKRIIGWLMKLNILIYINPNKPGYSYFREVIRKLKQGYIVVIFPEGTRSRTGKMIEPKLGFVKLALVAGVPVIPIGIKGAYEILPPDKITPRFSRCEIFVERNLIINKGHPLLEDILEDISYVKTSRELMEEIAFRLMNLIRQRVGQKWRDEIAWKPSKTYLDCLSKYLAKDSL